MEAFAEIKNESEDGVISEILRAGKKFLEETKTTTRYLSWEHCYNLFNEYIEYKYEGVKLKDKTLNVLVAAKDDDLIKDYLTLNLAFYLASWGMYRASTFLIEKDYKVHTKITECILKSDITNIKDVKNVDIDDFCNVVDNLKNEIKEIYQNIKLTKKDISDTLISKVILGTMGIVPAYDRYFIETLKKINRIRKENGKKTIIQRFTSESLRELMKLYKTNFKDVPEFQKLCKNSKYPPMKVIDMCFWKYAYNMSNNVVLIGNDQKLKDVVKKGIKESKNKNELKKTISIDEEYIGKYKRGSEIDAIPGFIKLKLENGKIYNWENEKEIIDYVKEIKNKLKKI